MFGRSKNHFSKADLKEAYETYFEGLRNFLYYKTGDIQLSEDLVQEVFVKIWAKRDEINKETIKSLLFTMGNNLAINYFNHKSVVNTHENAEMKVNRVENQTPQFLVEEKEFEEKLNNVLMKIPEGSREVFLMNRIDKLKYDEIATRLEISVKAVEKRMSKALNVVREELGIKI
ncbi:MAG: sigma-70 family RNA polymerase sigma factor [Cyclobacteriaceae bacterium]